MTGADSVVLEMVVRIESRVELEHDMQRLNQVLLVVCFMNGNVSEIARHSDKLLSGEWDGFISDLCSTEDVFKVRIPDLHQRVDFRHFL